jgi:hypothetical protein
VKRLTEDYIHFGNWQQYKQIIKEKTLSHLSLSLNKTASQKTKNGLIMLHDKRYYFFLDFPKRDNVRETGIPLHKDKNDISNIDENEVEAYLKNGISQPGNLLVLDYLTVI